MSENITETDPLSAAIGDYKPEFPVLAADRLLPFKLHSITKKVSEKGNTSLALKVELTKESVFDDGATARPGFKFAQNVNITPSGEYTIDSIKRILALWNQALLGKDKAKQVSFGAMRDHPEMFEGLVFTARTGIKKDKNGVYGDQTVLTPVIPS